MKYSRAGTLAATLLLTGAVGVGVSGAASTKVPLTELPKSGCGSVKLSQPQDQDKVLSKLDSKHRQDYLGYPFPVRKSQWANWKPKNKGPWTVGIQWSARNTDFQTLVTDGLHGRLNQDKQIDRVIFQSTANSVDVQAQLAAFESLVRQKPDILILQAISPTAFTRVIEEAARQGIPTIVPIQHVDSPAAVNIQTNAVQGGSRVYSALARQMGGRGNLLVAHAVPGSGPEVQGAAALQKVLANCPGLQVAGNITGNFVPALAKAETLKFLASNPTRIDGVIDINSMASGVLSAFQQTGRPMPATGIIGSTKGAFGYWVNNRSSFKGAASLVSIRGYGKMIADVTRGMLQGRGIKINAVTAPTPIVTPENIAQNADRSWTLETPGAVPGAKSWVPGNYLDNLFGKPAPKK